MSFIYDLVVRAQNGAQRQYGGRATGIAIPIVVEIVFVKAKSHRSQAEQRRR